MDKAVLLRAVHHNQTLHPTAIYLSLCGDILPRVVTPDSASMSRDDKPHFGSIVTKMLPAARPPRFRHDARSDGAQRPGMARSVRRLPRLGLRSLPPQYGAWLRRILARALASDPTLPPGRVGNRRALLAQLGQSARQLESLSVTKALDPHYVKAFDIIASPAAQRAFDVAAEPQSVHDRYGKHYFGECCLLARRLVEAGVRLVQVNWLRSNIGGPGGPGYDTHANHFPLCWDQLYPPTDKAFTTLIEDLDGAACWKKPW